MLGHLINQHILQIFENDQAFWSLRRIGEIGPNTFQKKICTVLNHVREAFETGHGKVTSKRES